MNFSELLYFKYERCNQAKLYIHKAIWFALKNGNVKILKLLIPLCDITGLFWGKNYLFTVLNKIQINISLQLIEKRAKTINDYRCNVPQ